MVWKDKIRHWCAIGERSKSEVLAKMKRLGAHEGEAVEMLKTLENEGFVDEIRFIEAFIHDHFLLKNWGPRKLYDGLLKKGCKSALIDPIISKLTEVEVEKALIRTINSRFTLYPDEHKTNRERLIRYLQNRGYTLDNILRALSRL